MDPDPSFHFDADPDPNPTFLCDVDPDPGPTTHFFTELYPPMLQNDPLRPFHVLAVADPDPAFTLIRMLVQIQVSTLMRFPK